MKKLIVTLMIVLFCIGAVVGCAETFGWYNLVGAVMMTSLLVADSVNGKDKNEN